MQKAKAVKQRVKRMWLAGDSPLSCHPKTTKISAVVSSVFPAVPPGTSPIRFALALLHL